MTRIKRFLVVLGVFTVFLFIGIAFTKISTLSLVDREYAEALNASSEESLQIIRQLEKAFISIRILEHFIKQKKGVIPSVGKVATELLGNYSNIEYLLLAPKGIVNNIYPQKNKNQLLNFDFQSFIDDQPINKGRNDSGIVRVLPGKKLFKKKDTIVGYLPVYIEEQAGENRLWGFVIALVNLKQLVRNGNTNLFQNYDYQLSNQPFNNNQSELILSTQSKLNRPVTFETKALNATWQLSIMPKGGWKLRRGVSSNIIFVLMTSLVMAVLAYTLVKQKEAEDTIKSQNKDLESKNLELGQIKNFLNNIVNSMPSALIGVDEAGIITQWNFETEQLTGTTSSEAEGQPLNEVFPQFIGQMAKITKAIEERKPQKTSKFEYLIKEKTHYYEVTVYPLVEIGVDNINGAAIRMDDITDRIQLENIMLIAETKLRESEEKYRSLFNSAPDGILITNFEGDIISFNNTTLKIFKYDNLDLFSRLKVNDLYNHPTVDRPVLLKELHEKGHIENMDLVCKDKFEKPFPASLSIKIMDYGGKSYIQSTIRDITKIKQMEAQLRDFTKNLEEMVGEKTEDLQVANEELMSTIESLEETRKELETRTIDLRKANESLQGNNETLEETLYELQEAQYQLIENEKMAALGRVIAGVAHEINTPVGIGITESSFVIDKINESLKAFRESRLTESHFEAFLDTTLKSSTSIFKNLSRAAKLINGFKQVAVDQHSEQKRIFNVKEYIDEILLNLHSKLKHTNHQVVVNCSKHLELNNFPGIFSQIITNFITNSLNHGLEEVENGMMEILVTEKQNSIELCYRDNGIGMDNITNNQVFNPFFTTKRNQGGTGLGMHIVYNLVTQKLNGQITSSSTPGSGVEFVISFPL